MRIIGKVAVVTGASGGIGAALAVELARRGARVGLVGRRGGLLEKVASEIASGGGTAASAVADVSDRAAVFEAVATLTRALGPVDVMVANAGVGVGDPAASYSSDPLVWMTKVNLLGAAYAFEAVIPEMVGRRSGHLVGISSLAAFRGLPGSSGYCATKAALSALLEAFRPELKPLGIAVTAVHPGFVRTPMIEHRKSRMPFEITAERAARAIAGGIEARRDRIDFPLRMVALMGLVRLLPNFVYDRFAPGVVRDA